MENWQILALAGFVVLMIELLTPTMFFLNIAIAFFVTAFASVYITNWEYLTYILVSVSAVLLVFIYPLMRKSSKTKKIETGIDKYIGQSAKVVEKVTKTSGMVAVFDERWKARIESGKDIVEGEIVEIYKISGLIVFVKKGE